jgi:recombination protein RecA
MDIIKKLRRAGLSSKPEDITEFVSTGSYAMNWVISGRFDGGIPIGAITQIQGGSSSAKTAVLSNVLGRAQKRGYHVAIADVENTLSPSYCNIFGLDSDNLILYNTRSIEETFDWMEKVISEIRKEDPDTPIVVGLDSLAQLGPQDEIDAEGYGQSNTDGMIRAKKIGGCLRKFFTVVKKEKVALVIINQIREKIAMYGDPEVKAAGGRALDFYLSVDLKTHSNKTTDIIRNSNKVPMGITGKMKNLKNKISIPFLNCSFELIFNEGITEYFGLLPILVQEGHVTQNGAWYEANGKKFQSKDFISLLHDSSVEGFDPLRNLLNLTLEKQTPGSMID